MESLLYGLLYNRNYNEWSTVSTEKEAIKILLSKLAPSKAEIFLPGKKNIHFLSTINKIDILYEQNIGVANTFTTKVPECCYLQSNYDLHHDLVFKKNNNVLPIEIKFLRHTIDESIVEKMFINERLYIPRNRFWGTRTQPPQSCGHRDTQCEGQLITDIVRLIRTIKIHNKKYYFNVLKALYICKSKTILESARDLFYTKLFRGNKGTISIENNDNSSTPTYRYWYELEWGKDNKNIISIVYPNEIVGTSFYFNVNFINNIIEVTVKIS